MIIESRAFARAGLLGNPSDGYYGKTISITVRNFGAHVSLYHTPELRIEPAEQDQNVFRNMYHLKENINRMGYYGGMRLVLAAIKKFTEYCETHDIKHESKNFTIRYYSTIPRQVGLAGSSAIVTATIRALMQFYEVEIPLPVLPSLVLSAEQEELGINAGLQDRVIQAFEGCVYMDFEKSFLLKHNYGKYERLDPVLLPNLFIAYKTTLSKESGKVLNNIREQYEKGDPLVVDTLSGIAQCAQEGRSALEDGDVQLLSQCMDRNFDLRSKIMHITEPNREMVEVARSCGASAKFPGSGGAIIGVYEDNAMLNRLINELKKINARVIKPHVM